MKLLKFSPIALLLAAICAPQAVAQDDERDPRKLLYVPYEELQADKRPPVECVNEEGAAAQEARPCNQRIWTMRLIENYPVDALRNSLTGTVEFAVAIGPDGRPFRCDVTQSSGHAILDESACASVMRHAMFYPALDEKGEPTEGRWASTLVYSLGNAEPSPEPKGLSRDPRPRDVKSWFKPVYSTYPKRAARHRLFGRVGMELTIDARGKVSDCVVTQSSGHEILDEAACEGFRKFSRFDPALDAQGEPTTGKFDAEVNYSKP
ncbi:energy transducer TonB [Paraurantiacibacter namhicola]|uniref:Gram-negative bacterial tonB protein n=1 Tax=Paraurantiacibacter namhicola TaxID=645517 RepID=A0A1C7D828_9SPHN|nr:energy transducer TonB [Paraurantiacibacter namhicola]ANU07443.1 Gram-negative bacterial tonB protein [Paraurantiacibacter namhicola]